MILLVQLRESAAIQYGSTKLSENASVNNLIFLCYTYLGFKFSSTTLATFLVSVLLVFNVSVLAFISAIVLLTVTCNP